MPRTEFPEGTEFVFTISRNGKVLEQFTVKTEWEAASCARNYRLPWPAACATGGSGDVSIGYDAKYPK